MKKLFLLLSLIIITFLNTQAKTIIKTDAIMEQNGLSVYLNNSDGSTDKIGLQAISCYPVANPGIFVYDISFCEQEGKISVGFMMYNFYNVDKNICCMAAVYRNNVLIKTKVVHTKVNANQAGEEILSLSEFDPQTDKIQAYVWDSMNGIMPLGKTEKVTPDENVISRKYAYVTCEQGESFNLYVTSPEASENIDLRFRLGFDSSEISVENLCALKSQNILTEGYISGTGINIIEFSDEDGIIEYNETIRSGFCGINNIITFTAKANLINEEITLTVSHY